jgi:hypothetical protein
MAIIIIWPETHFIRYPYVTVITIVNPLTIRAQIIIKLLVSYILLIGSITLGIIGDGA